MSPRPFLALAVLALAAACSTPPASPSASVAVETPAPSSATPSGPSTMSAAAGQTQTHTSDGVESTVTVLRMRRPLPVVIPLDPHLPETPGHEYVAVEVKWCLVKSSLSDPITVSWSPWSLAFHDGTVVEALSSWSAEWWGVPLYPAVDHVVRPGRCVRGWVPFEVDKRARVERVEYAAGVGGDVLEWRVS